MNKIPTLFVRDFTAPSNGRWVTREVTPGCEWVLAGEGRATRKYDGTCVLIRRDGLAVQGWARREVKPGKEPPPSWREVEADATTGKRVGWEPIEQSGFAKFFTEAVSFHDELNVPLEPGTYELCGPKINGNPEHFDRHLLIPHGKLDMDSYTPRDYDSLSEFLPSLEAEGIVWHHPDGRMAKLKRRDFEEST